MSVTSKTYSFLGDLIGQKPTPPAPTPPEPVEAPPELPPSVMMVSGAHITARCQQLAVSPEFKTHASGNQPIELTKLVAAAHRLVLEAMGFGDARDQAAAKEAEAAGAALETVWLDGAQIAAPAPELPDLEEPGPVGKPRVGSQVCYWREQDGGQCLPAVVTKVWPGSWATGAVVSPESPYIQLINLAGERNRPINARWISQPVANATPGMRDIIHSWHRSNPHECPTMRRG